MNKLIKTAKERYRRSKEENHNKELEQKKKIQEQSLKRSKNLLNKFDKIFGKEFRGDVELKYDELNQDHYLKIKDVEVRLYNANFAGMGKRLSEIPNRELLLRAVAIFEDRYPNTNVSGKSKFRPIKNLSELGDFIYLYEEACKKIDQEVKKQR